MEDSPILFEGDARVYLQGQNALFPILSDNYTQQITYYIGDNSSHLVLRDHRPATITEAVQAIQTKHQNGFAKHFNQPAHVVVRLDEDSGKMEIDIHERKNAEKIPPTIWMGILENNIMPGYEVLWEVFRAVDSTRTAFVALVPARDDAKKMNLTGI